MILRKILWVVLILLLHFPTVAQNRSLIDSLRNRLNNEQTENQFNVLNALAWEYRFATPDTTIYYSTKAFDLGTRLQLKLNLAKPLNFLGVAYNYKGDRIKAFEFYQKAIQIAESQADSVQMAYANNNIGRLLFEQGVVAKSFNYYVNALKLFTVTNDLSGIAYAKQSLASLYRVQLDYAKAQQSYKEALQIRLQLKNSRDIMAAYNYLGTLVRDNDQIELSNTYFLKADSVARLTNDIINLAEINILLAENYLKLGQLDQARELGTKGFEVIKRMNNRRMLPEAHLLIGKIYLAKKQYANAIIEFTAALRVAKETQVSSFQMEAYFQLATASSLMGKKQDEIGYMNHYLVLKDSIEDLELARKVERLQFELQIETKEKENELLKLQKAQTESVISRQRLINVFSWMAIIFLAVLAIISWRVSKRRKDINTQLAIQNHQINEHQQEIATQNEALSKRNNLLSDIINEKDTLMSIVAHDLKAPLNRITGLVQLIELDGPLNERQKDYVSKIKESTKGGSSLITDLLDVHAMEGNNNLPIPEVFDLGVLMNECINAQLIVAQAKNITLETNTAPASVFTDKSYLYRILENLLSNAIKFSVSGSSIRIQGEVNSGKIILKVKDQGPGFTEEDQRNLYRKFKRLSARPTASESSNGLGLAIVKTLVDRLNGSIELTTKPKEGSEFIVTLPAL
ncbi:MAG: ATP-binding protein [Cyclobacteriaceae bacterium]|jgi:signal transduction histidine kinase/Tfp pilus assembly protein PilF|nr:ATP-binding protein [Flammeovirgaceae bacterium]